MPKMTETVCTEVGWYILSLGQQLVGPYNISELQEQYSSGYLTPSTLVWPEGCSECQWQPLSSVPGLLIDAPPQTAPKLVPVASNEEDEFEKWQREVREAEIEIVNDEERPTTPTEGEEEFTDDDGTSYKWDRSLKAWVPQENITPKDEEHALDNLTFVQEEEGFPVVNDDYVPMSADDLPVKKDDPPVKEEVADAVEVVEEKQNGRQQVPEKTDDKFDRTIVDKKEAFVPLALRILDGVPLRPDGKIPMKVTRAKFEQKGDRLKPKEQVDKNKKEELQKVEQKMLGRGGRDDTKVSFRATVVLRHLFTTAEMRADETLRSRLEEKVRDECALFGPLDDVKVCGKHPHGVVLVKYKDSEDAQLCVEKINGRQWFSNKRILANIDDGKVDHTKVLNLVDEIPTLHKYGALFDASENTLLKIVRLRK